MTASELRTRIEGEVLEPGDPAFEDARSLWNMRFDRRPDLVARCSGSEDVAAAIDFARSRDMPLTVKAGGHSYAAHSVAGEGLLIDLGEVKTIDVDLDRKTATIGPGVTCGMLDAATQEHGLATTTPTVSSVGVIGAALGVSRSEIRADPRQRHVGADGHGRWGHGGHRSRP